MSGSEFRPVEFAAAALTPRRTLVQAFLVLVDPVRNFMPLSFDPPLQHVERPRLGLIAGRRQNLARGSGVAKDKSDQHELGIVGMQTVDRRLQRGLQRAIFGRRAGATGKDGSETRDVALQLDGIASRSLRQLGVAIGPVGKAVNDACDILLAVEDRFGDLKEAARLFVSIGERRQGKARGLVLCRRAARRPVSVRAAVGETVVEWVAIAPCRHRTHSTS